MEKKKLDSDLDFEARKLQKEEELYLALIALVNVNNYCRENKTLFLTRNDALGLLYYYGKAVAMAFETAIQERLLEMVRESEDDIIEELERGGIKVSLNDSLEETNNEEE